MDGTLVGPSLIKQLASCNQTLRERSVRLLIKTWLPTQTEISDADLKKLWKGLFYCVWHADKAQFQAQLINRLSSMLLTLDLPLSLQYLSVFLNTMRREWNGIDSHRLDKFYLLIRRFVHSMFGLLKKFLWDLGLVGKVMGILEEATFCAKDNLQGHGVSYHIASLFLEEMRYFLPLKLEIVELLLKPFVDVIGRSPDKVLLGKIRSNVFDVLLTNGKNLLDEKKSGIDIDSGDDVVVYGTIALKIGVSARFYELGSSPDCLQGNRKILFSLHEQFSRLEKDLASSGVEISLPDVSVDGEDEDVPMLVPINGQLENGASKPADAAAAAKLTKKRKKSKKASEDGEDDKKKNKKKKKKDAVPENGSINDDPVQLEPEVSKEDEQSNGNSMNMDDSMILNLQKQFELAAAEEGLSESVLSACDSEGAVSGIKLSKKKRTKKSKNESEGGDGEDLMASAKSGEKSSKKVTFSMNSNLVWKPHTPLPPEHVRIPPSVTPRGSALKKGLSPGPVRDMSSSSSSKKARQRGRAVKKVKRTIRSPAVKRPKKLKV